MAGGAAGMIGGALACTTGIGCLVGGPSFVLGADQFNAGFNQTDSGLSQLIQWMGVGREGANVLDSVVNLVANLGVGFVSSLATTAVTSEAQMIQGVVDKTVAGFAENPQLAASFLYRGELNAVQNSSKLTAPLFGTAVERSVAGQLSGGFTSLSRPGLSVPDLRSLATGTFYDITTTNPATIAAHLSRPYVQNGSTTLIYYTRPLGFTFPK
jgi:hypothetical protein